MQAAFGDVVEWDHIDVCAHSCQLLCQQLRLLRTVAHAVDHRIFKGNAPPGLRKIITAGCQQCIDRPAAVDRHNLAARFVVWRMQGDRKRQLQISLGKLFDLVDEAAGGEADVAHADVHAVRAVDKLEKAHDIVEVIQRLTDAHQHNIGDRQAGIQLGKEHLVEKLRRLESADKTADGGRAEFAAHRAADLRRDADGVAMVVLHDDGFDAVAVAQLPEVFDRPVELGDLLAGNGGCGDVIEAVQFFAQGL